MSETDDLSALQALMRFRDKGVVLRCDGSDDSWICKIDFCPGSPCESDPFSHDEWQFEGEGETIALAVYQAIANASKVEIS